MYVDGVVVGSVAAGDTYAAYATPDIFIGGTPGGNPCGAAATEQLESGTKVDDARVYNRALSAAEVKQLYHLGTANLAHTNTVAVSNGLVGYWPLDGNTTNWTTGIETDISTGGNNGALINMSTTTSPVAGKVGQAIKFDGASSYITQGNPSNLQISNG